MKNLGITVEIAAAYLSGSMTDVESFKADPHAYIASKHNSSIGEGKDLNIVENSDSTVHLGLPYYSGLDASSADGISDENLDDIAGGEIWITITVLSQVEPERIGLPPRDEQPAK